MIKTTFGSVLASRSLWWRVLELAILIVLFVVCAGVVEATRDHPNVLEQIALEGTLANSDAVLLQNDLIWLRDNLPQWYQYVVDAKPFTLSIDPEWGTRGIAANTKCCDRHGNGTIIFSERFGEIAVSSEAEDQTFEAKRIEFLSTLIHEVTHVRDKRSGDVSESMGFASCVKGEQSAYGKELEFKHAVASLAPGDPARSTQRYRQVVARHLADEDSAFNRKLWVMICLAWQPSD